MSPTHVDLALGVFFCKGYLKFVYFKLLSLMVYCTNIRPTPLLLSKDS